MTKVTIHRNWHVVIKIYNNVIFVIKLLITKKMFEKTLDCVLKDNTKITNIDLFQKKMIILAEGIFLQNYICQA